MALLADGLRCGRLRSLKRLSLAEAQIGPQGAPALTKRALPSLLALYLETSQIGGAGLTTLAPALRQLPKLETLSLRGNEITDQGLASLLAPPTAGVLPSLATLWLDGNQITDEGCATLASALRGGALPTMQRYYNLRLSGNPASAAAQQAVEAEMRTR